MFWTLQTFPIGQNASPLKYRRKTNAQLAAMNLAAVKAAKLRDHNQKTTAAKQGATDSARGRGKGKGKAGLSRPDVMVH